jgi:hypothetical protein
MEREDKGYVPSLVVKKSIFRYNSLVIASGVENRKCDAI